MCLTKDFDFLKIKKIINSIFNKSEILQFFVIFSPNPRQSIYSKNCDLWLVFSTFTNRHSSILKSKFSKSKSFTGICSGNCSLFHWQLCKSPNSKRVDAAWESVRRVVLIVKFLFLEQTDLIKTCQRSSNVMGSSLLFTQSGRLEPEIGDVGLVVEDVQHPLFKGRAQGAGETRRGNHEHNSLRERGTGVLEILHRIGHDKEALNGEGRRQPDRRVTGEIGDEKSVG